MREGRMRDVYYVYVYVTRCDLTWHVVGGAILSFVRVHFNCLGRGGGGGGGGGRSWYMLAHRLDTTQRRASFQDILMKRMETDSTCFSAHIMSS